MTEKRFACFIHNINEDDEYYEIIDKEERYSFNDVQDGGLAEQVCRCLNILSDENRQLRTQVLLNEQQDTIEKQELRLQCIEKLLELSENLNKSYREKLIDMNLKMMRNDDE